ncbi:MAG TPA: T9SS type A sorting domain-containing protein [Puia sp.]|jgi:hypothetical protein|nr:T9SS type A sorting domain-containing protein [Puia sp.]
MTKLYPTCVGKLLLSLILSAIFSYSSHGQSMVTYDTTFGGWNAIVTEDVALKGTDSAAGIIFFPGIGQETTNINDLKVNGPHYLISNGMWDGSVPLGNGVHHPFIISLQPPSSGYSAAVVLPKVQAILARYRIKRNSLYMTGLSCGGWQANEFVAYEPTPGDNTCGKMVRAIVNLEGVEPADSTPLYPSESYPRKMGHWASTCGGRELWVEGSNDWRDMLAGAQNMTDSVAGSATYFQVTYGGGAHCCWNTEYEPSTTWTLASNSNISQLVGQPQAMNVWQWLLRQGDTTMPASETGGKTIPLGTTPPTVGAGKGQTITLPASSATLTGTAAGNGGASITGLTWKESSGPATAAFASPNSLSTTVSGMTVAGSYVFTLYATDNNGMTANGSVTVTVDPAVTGTAPTVSAGKGQAITLPANVTTLTGTAAGNGGASITGLTWKQSAGPATAAITSPYSLSTAVSGMSKAGSYIFTLYATDNTGKTANGSMTVVVNATGTAAVRTAAVSGQATSLTDSTAMVDPVITDQVTAPVLYPNPVQDLLNIRLSDPVAGKVVASIYNMAGNCVRRVELQKDFVVLEASIDVSGLPKGLYVVQVFTGTSTRSAGKFIKL